MVFTHSELEEAELMKFYCNDDILICKVILQAFSNDFHNDLWSRLGLGLLFLGNMPAPEGETVAGGRVTASARRNRIQVFGLQAPRSFYFPAKVPGNDF